MVAAHCFFVLAFVAYGRVGVDAMTRFANVVGFMRSLSTSGEGSNLESVGEIIAKGKSPVGR